MLATLTGLLFGLLQGVRHAFEPDHLAAVSTLVADPGKPAGASGRRVPLRALFLGAAWGLGHTITLMVVGGALLLLRTSIPPRVEAAFELCVAIMLVVLGARSVARAFVEGSRGAHHVHAHGERRHSHAGAHDHVHLRWLAGDPGRQTGGWPLARRPLLIGLMHGLAGSGALTAVVVSRVSSTAAGLAFMLLFGVGSTAGMAALTGVMGWPLAKVARHPRAMSWLLGATGALSLIVGVVWGVRTLA